MPKRGLTTRQKNKAWKLLNEGGDNRDFVIAKKLGVTKNMVSVYLRVRSEKEMRRITKRVGL